MSEKEPLLPTKRCCG